MGRRRLATGLLGWILLGACGEAPDSQLPEPAEGEWRRGILLLGDLPVIRYQLINGQRVYEGDILLEPHMVAELGTEPIAVRRQELLSIARSGLWPEAVVPYTIDSSVSATLRTRIESAIRHYAEKTPIRFVPRNGEAGYATFRDVGYEQATPGRTGSQQFINLASSSSVGVIIHEMGHCTGLKHEHMRPDRNDFITIHYENIRDGYQDQFDVFSIGESVGEYDIGSVMHYSMTTWSKNGLPTITRKDGSSFPTNFTALSAKDIAGIENLYGGARPNVAITGPASGATVSGSVTVTADASGSSELASVTFFVDSTLLGTDSSPPYSVEWNSTSVSDGSMTLTAVVEDVYGRETRSETVPVQVRNAPAPTDPEPVDPDPVDPDPVDPPTTSEPTPPPPSPENPSEQPSTPESPDAKGEAPSISNGSDEPAPKGGQSLSPAGGCTSASGANALPWLLPVLQAVFRRKAAKKR